ncbi:hypothetical protein MKW94_003674 [Papaver nudicaule]|uniref:Transmembrane protein n=1 Tax=Papaver nudicaule TaxID=74823 RepID=A0AA42AXK3_PAPNU|nr:hypothetical protein [Papaver nudicaule]
MESISTRYPRTICLIMFLLVAFNLLTTISAGKDDSELIFTKMNSSNSRKLLRVRPWTSNIPSPRGNPSNHFYVSPPPYEV